MIDDSDAILDDLLCRWYEWQRAYGHARGFAPRSAVVGEFRVSRQWDDFNGALDEQIEKDLMTQVDFQISELPDEQRWTIQFLARALAWGASPGLAWWALADQLMGKSCEST